MEDLEDTKQKILIVDNNPENTHKLISALSRSYEIVNAIFGSEAVKLSEKELPALVLADMRLPDISPLELLQKLKSNPKTKDIPIIFLSDSSDRKSEAEVLLNGAADCISKPFNLPAVEVRLRTQLDLCRYKEQIENMVYERTEKLAQSNKRLREEIAEKKRIEEKLILQTTALDAAANAVIISDAKGTIHWVNKAFTQMTGYTFEEAVGRKTNLLKSGRQDTEFYQRMWNTILSGDVWRGDLINRRKNGTMYTEEMIITPVHLTGDKITHFIAIKSDITSDLEINSKLRQSQKLEAIGALTGGIAHDFNNILYAIVGYSELLAKSITPSDESAQHLEQIIRAAKRAKELIGQILTFSRKSETNPQPVQLQSVLKETLKLLRGSLPSTIEIQEHIDPDCGFIKADATQLYQVIMNLCTNAFHAMKQNKGVLEIFLKQMTLASGTIPELAGGVYVRLTVKDTGHGIDQSILKKIFDPFFTTKPPGEGTGLGLSTVLGIVKSHKGSVQVRSAIGKGTEFDVYFPVCEHVSVQPEHFPEKISLSGSEHILVVDDEDAIVQMTKIKLAYQGYQVSCFTSSVEALDAIKKSPDTFDIIITDQTMPVLTGLELAKQVRLIRSDIPIILCTGYSDMIKEEDAKSYGIQKWFRKPLMGEELETCVRSLLNKSNKELHKTKKAIL